MHLISVASSALDLQQMLLISNRLLAEKIKTFTIDIWPES